MNKQIQSIIEGLLKHCIEINISSDRYCALFELIGHVQGIHVRIYNNADVMLHLVFDSKAIYWDVTDHRSEEDVTRKLIDLYNQLESYLMVKEVAHV